MKVLKQFGMGSGGLLLVVGATGAQEHRAMKGWKKPRKGVAPERGLLLDSRTGLQKLSKFAGQPILLGLQGSG